MKKIIFIISVLFAMVISLNAATEEELKANLTKSGVKKVSIDEYSKMFKQTDVKEIEKILNNAIKLDSKNYYAKEDLAAIYLSQNGKENDAIKLLEEAIKLDSKNNIPYVNLLKAYGKLNKAQEYVNTLNSLITNIPDYPEGYRLGAMFLMGNKQNQKAASYIEQALTAYANNVGMNKYKELYANKNVILADTYMMEISNYIALGNIQKAIDTFLSRRVNIKAASIQAEKQMLEEVKKANETLKSIDKKAYNANLKKLK